MINILYKKIKNKLESFTTKKSKMISNKIHTKQDKLKRKTDRRFDGIMIGTPPPLLSEKDLKVGDVLFCSKSNDDKMSNLIQKTTDGPYTHCAIYFGNNTIVHMTTRGIKAPNNISDFISEYTYIAVTRCPGLKNPDFELYPIFKKKLIDFIQSNLDKKVKYNIVGAGLSPLREYKNISKHYAQNQQQKNKVKDVDKKSYFCSEFILDCFKATEYIDKDHSYWKADNWTPTGLAEENIFDLVGFMSNNGLHAVSSQDPHLMGYSYTRARKAFQQ
ncbi:hypothetical protein [Photobacterium leiognathi]|uniref:hypothetical protein n=1 Tax=Photobacterium leiognathi TaxID=553611 RepID=UPI002739C8BB|nr:hypothetical protein [Photobacterium leiognathi]